MPSLSDGGFDVRARSARPQNGREEPSSCRAPHTIPAGGPRAACNAPGCCFFLQRGILCTHTTTGAGENLPVDPAALPPAQERDVVLHDVHHSCHLEEQQHLACAAGRGRGAESADSRPRQRMMGTQPSTGQSRKHTNVWHVRAGSVPQQRRG
jgi:hypothetical protein